jgi:phosphoribosylpyrophosphate synthetase
MREYDIVLGSGSLHFKEQLERLGYRVYVSELNYDGKRIFPNADIYTRIANVEELCGRKVIVIQTCTGSSPVENEAFTTSDRLVDLMLTLDVLNAPETVREVTHKEFNCIDLEPPRSIDVILTYQPFALQDKSFKTGEATSASWAIRTIAKSCDKVWVVNPHSPESLHWVRKLIEEDKLESIDVADELVEFAAKKFGFDDYIVVTPDEGGQERFLCDGYGKKRMSSFAVELSGDLDVKGKHVIIIDDLTKSGSTLMKTANRLMEQGAKSYGMAVVHVLPIIGQGEQLLRNLVEKSKGLIVTTNTVYTRTFCEEHPELTCNILGYLIDAIASSK